MLDPQAAGANGQSRIPDFLGNGFPQNIAGAVPVGGVAVNPAIGSPVGYGAYPTTAIPTTGFGYPTPTGVPGVIPTPFGFVPTPAYGYSHPAIHPTAFVNPFSPISGYPTINPYSPVNPMTAFNPFAAINPFATTGFTPYTPGVPTIPTIHPSFVNPLAMMAVQPHTSPLPFMRNLFGQPTINPFINPIFGTLPMTGSFVDPISAAACQSAACGTINPMVNPAINPTLAQTIGAIHSVNPWINPGLTGLNPLACTTPAGVGSPFAFNPVVNPFVAATTTGFPFHNPWATPTPYGNVPNPFISRLNGSLLPWTGASAFGFPGGSIINNPLASICQNPFTSALNNPWLANILASCCGLNTACCPTGYGSPFGAGTINPFCGPFGIPVNTPGCWPTCGV